MRIVLVALTVLVALSPLPFVATPAAADVVTKAQNTVVNTALGWLECPKAAWHEAAQAPKLYYVGVAVTAPALCAVNVGVRYLGVAGDILTLPWGGNLVSPNVLHRDSPVSIP